MTYVKICSITNLADALTAIDAGADAISFIFVPNTPRYIDALQAAEIVRQLPPFMKTVTIAGVFANADRQEIESTVGRCRLDVVQLHGEETPDFCHSLNQRVIKALAVEDESSLLCFPDYRVSAYLLDTKIVKPNIAFKKIERRGETLDWELAVKAKQYGKIILAGGLNPDNVVSAVKKVRPYAVDVTSGVEVSRGRKDPAKVHAFIQAVRSVEG